MASANLKPSKMKRLESKKSHSWWWDSHISPKNSKWLQENLDEMDQHIKRMLKLVDQDADSFAKKAELYFQKRPELTGLVEDFYRMYRSLAERYDHVTGELRKNVPSDIQSQGSGISDVGSEPPSTIPSPDRKAIRRKSSSGHRAAGFDYFLGNGSDLNSKEGDDSSTLDSESESDESSVNNYSATHSNEDDPEMRRKIIELEVELREVKERLKAQEEEESEGSEISSKIAKYEEEIQFAKLKIQQSKEEISTLTSELQKYKSLENVIHNQVREVEETFNSETEILDESQSILEELRNVQEKLRESEAEVLSLRQEITNKGSSIQTLQDQLKSSNKEVSAWKNKLEREKREVSKVQDRIVRYKSNLSDREQEIRGLKEAISNSNKSLSEENEQLKVDSTKMLKEKAYLEENLREFDLRCQSLEEEVRRITNLKSEVEISLRAQIQELREELDGRIQELNYENEYLSAKIDELRAEVSLKDEEIDEMSKHLDQLHVEHVELIDGAEKSSKRVEELVSKVKELEKEIEKKQDIILEGAEEKREAIRQLCFSLEHYRNGYHMLRQVVIGHKRTPIMAS